MFAKTALFCALFAASAHVAFAQQPYCLLTAVKYGESLKAKHGWALTPDAASSRIPLINRLCAVKMHLKSSLTLGIFAHRRCSLML